MSKNVLSDSLIDQQNRTLNNKIEMSDHFLKHCPKVLEVQYRPAVHQCHCRGTYVDPYF